MLSGAACKVVSKVRNFYVFKRHRDNIKSISKAILASMFVCLVARLDFPVELDMYERREFEVTNFPQIDAFCCTASQWLYYTSTVLCNQEAYVYREFKQGDRVSFGMEVHVHGRQNAYIHIETR